MTSRYWQGVRRKLATTPHGNAIAIARHNCYRVASSPAESLRQTLDLVHQAIPAGADLIELDIKDEAGRALVDHEDTGGANGAFLGDVLADPAFMQSDQLLFLEFKESAPAEAFVRQVLDLIARHGYAREGRPVILRTFDVTRRNVALARDLLATPAYETIRPFVRMHVLFYGNQEREIGTFQSLIRKVKEDGFQGVELHYQDENIAGKIAHAHSLGLGVCLYTVPVAFGEVFVGGLREEVDAIIGDYPVDKARAVAESNNGLLYLNTAGQTGAGNAVTYLRGDTVPYTAAVGVAGAPSFETLGAGEDRFGGSLVLDASRSQSMTFHDADNSPDDGYLVTAVVNFDRLELNAGETSCVLAKSDAAGFTLELHCPAGSSTVLRFGVHVAGAYRYAQCPASRFNLTDSYFITGAYDGDGGVRLWVNNHDEGIEIALARGGVTRNDTPVVLGADPQGQRDRRFFFSGKVQQVQVQRWGAH